MINYSPIALTAGLKADFFQSFRRASLKMRNLVGLVAQQAPSSRRAEKYYYRGESPAMQLVTDQYPESNVGELEYELTNQKYGATFKFKREDLEDDLIGAIRETVQGMGIYAAKHVNYGILDAITAGDTELCFDGTAFFGNSHARRGKMSAVGDNLLSGAGTSVANIKTDLQAVLSAFAAMESENGKAYHDTLSEIVILHPVALEDAFSDALEAEIISNTSNTMRKKNISHYGFAQLDLDDVNDWYAFHTGGGLLPIKFQNRRPTMLERLNAGDSQFFRDEESYKASARRAFGYNNWRDAIKVVNS